MKKVIVNGTFDLLHAGHVELLEFAKMQGDYLLVAIDSDRRVKELKGESRPINNQLDRKRVLEGLKSTDEIVIFDIDNDLLEFVSSCHLMIKGSDYADKHIIGQDLIKVMFYDRTTHSTTKIIQNITDR
jgi:D-beta-D-heptose 7-phosphate kinase/D-beta-D-heptose 1-phosphate adenosyltransferase